MFRMSQLWEDLLKLTEAIASSQRKEASDMFREEEKVVWLEWGSPGESGGDKKGTGRYC